MLSFVTFILGLSTMIVVDSVGPVLHEQSIDFCESPSREMIMQALQCKNGEKIEQNQALNDDVGVMTKESPLNIPAGCGVSCQEKVTFVSHVDNHCHNFELLCKERVYNLLGQGSCMLLIKDV